MHTTRRNVIAGAVTAGIGWLTGNRPTHARRKDAPLPKQPGTVKYSRDIPVRYEADVAVIGGGIAGVSAACAAAKSEAKVILIERFAVTGGVLTTGGVANFCGQMNAQGEVFDTILSDLRKFNALGYKNKESVFHREILALVLQELLLERGVKLLLHTRFVDVVQTDGLITECIILGKSGPEPRRRAAIAYVPDVFRTPRRCRGCLCTASARLVRSHTYKRGPAHDQYLAGRTASKCNQNKDTHV
jgi:hypothetical protein